MFERYWGVREVAERLGITAAAAAQAHLPEPDAWIGQTRGWRPETIEAWIPTRPGKGRWRKALPVEPASTEGGDGGSR